MAKSKKGSKKNKGSKSAVALKQPEAASLKTKENAKKSTAEKVQRKTVPSAKTKKKFAGGQYIKEVRQEMKRVAWPNREQIKHSTLIVLIVVIFFTIYVGLIDIVFIRVVKYLTFSF